MKNLQKLKMFLKISFDISPSYFFLLLFGSLLSSLQVFLNVLIPKYLIDELLKVSQSNIISNQPISIIYIYQNFKLVFIYGLLIVTFNLVFGVILKTYHRIIDVKNIYMQDKIQARMAKKIMSIPYSNLEDPYYLDLKERAVFACTNQSALANLINNITGIYEEIIVIIGLLIIIFTLSPLLVFLLSITIIIIAYIRLRYKDYETKFYQDLIPINRKYGYYMSVGFDSKYAKDIRLFDASTMIEQKVKEYSDEFMSSFKKRYIKLGKMSGIIKVINVLQATIIYLYVALRGIGVMGKKISVGDFMMYVNASLRFSNSLTNVFQRLILISQMLSYLDPLLEFMTIEEEEVKKSNLFLKEIETIRFEQVSFKYPKSDLFVLKNISFNVNKNEKISIVGLNGAGKTTLIKLLCRLYEPTSGHIYINDIDIFAYDYESYRKRIAAVFQDYQLFAYSIEENIIGNNQFDAKKMKQILTQVGLDEKIDTLKEGIKTPLNKYYDKNGVELSGGENQKIAIARALYKEAELVILDEPTSALDPLAEAEIYEHFNELVKDKTAFYISHRMSSSVFCDRILIIDKGIIVDYDTHTNLMKQKNSIYYQLFTVQAKNYQINH